jgi:hypothetical protein
MKSPPLPASHLRACDISGNAHEICEGQHDVAVQTEALQVRPPTETPGESQRTSTSLPIIRALGMRYSYPVRRRRLKH